MAHVMLEASSARAGLETVVGIPLRGEQYAIRPLVVYNQCKSLANVLGLNMAPRVIVVGGGRKIYPRPNSTDGSLRFECSSHRLSCRGKRPVTGQEQ